MRSLRLLFALPALALGSCSSPNVEMIFPVAETIVDSSQGAAPLHGVTTSYGGQVPVFVGPSKAPQTLSLMSESSTIWHVYLFPGANVSKIYVAGFDQQRVIVAHSRRDSSSIDPEIINLSGNLVGHDTLSFGPPISLSGQKGEAYKAELKRETGLELTGFAGIQQVCLNCAFAISMSQHPSDDELNDHFPAAVRRNRRSATADYERVRHDISTLADRGALPAKMPLFENIERQEDEVRHWTLLPEDSPTPYGSRDCGRIALGSPSDDAMWCGGHRGYDADTSWIIAGDGSDILGDADEASQLLSGGRGDDIINAWMGNDVIYFERGWGNDIVDLRCLSTPDDSPLPPYQDSRYIVFGSGVRPSDLRWLNDREIEDKATGSRIRLTGELCAAKFIAVEQGTLPERPMQEETDPPVATPGMLL